MLIMNGSTILMDIFLSYNMAVIIFDLFGTLIDIDDNQNDYDKALKWLADTYFENRFIELKKLSEIFKAKYLEDRKKSNKENSFFNQLTFFETTLGIEIYGDFTSVELNFIHLFRREKLIDGTHELLKYLIKNNYRIFILSNSIFSGTNLKIHLDHLGIGKYIEELFSSADIGFRKPSKEIFTYVINRLEIKNPKEVYFVGDSLEKDYNGAKNIGFTPILMGVNEEIVSLKFTSLPNLLEYLRTS